MSDAEMDPNAMFEVPYFRLTQMNDAIASLRAELVEANRKLEAMNAVIAVVRKNINPNPNGVPLLHLYEIRHALDFVPAVLDTKEETL